MDYLSKASILLCCCLFLFADGQHTAKRFGRKENDESSKSNLPTYLTRDSKSNQEIFTETKENSRESQTNVVNDVEFQETSPLNSISLSRRQGRREVAFGSRLSGRTNKTSTTTIRPNLNAAKSQIRNFSTEKPAFSDLVTSNENGSRRKPFNKLNSQARKIKEKEITASTEEFSSTTTSYESSKVTHGTVRRFTTKRGFNRQSKPGFVLSTISPVSTHPKLEIFPTDTWEKSSDEIQLKDEKLNNNSLPSTKPGMPYNHIKSRITQKRLNKLRPEFNSELLKAESEAPEILSNKNDEKISDENRNDGISSSLPRRKTNRFTKRPLNKLSSNLQNIFASKSTHLPSSDSIIEIKNASLVENSFKSLKQESDASEKLNSKSDDEVSEEKPNEHTSSILPRRKTAKLTKRPFNKLNLNLQNLPAFKSSDELPSDYFNEDQNLSQLESSSEQPFPLPQTESTEKLTEPSNIHKKEPEEINEDSNSSFNSNRLKRVKFIRRPSSKLNTTREGTIVAKTIRKTYMVTEEPVSSNKEDESEKIIPVRTPQWPQTESLEFDTESALHSVNIEDTQVIPFLPVQNKGNKRRTSHKLNHNQQDLRVTNSKRNSDISEEIIKNQQQFSNLKFDPIKPTKWSQAESLDSTTDNIFHSENYEDNHRVSPFLSNRKRGNKRRLSHNLNSNKHDSKVTNSKITIDISEDIMKSQQQFSNLQFDPIKPTQWPQAGSMESYTSDIVDSENTGNTQPEAPLLPNQRKGSKRRQSNKLNINQQDSRVENPERTTDIREDMIKSQQQYSDLQFNPIKPIQSSEKDPVGKSTQESIGIFRNSEKTLFISNRHRKNKNTRRSSIQRNRSRQNAFKTNPAQQNPLVSDSKDSSRFEDFSESLPFNPPQVMTNENPRRVTEKTDEFFSHRDIVPFHSYRHRGSKNTRRPASKKSVPTSQRQREIQKPQNLQANNYHERYPYSNAEVFDHFAPFGPSQLPGNGLPPRSSERDSPFEAVERLKESEPRRRSSGKLNSDQQSGAEISVLNHKTDTIRYEKPEIPSISRDITHFVPSHYNHQPYFYPAGYSINGNERFEIHPTSTNRNTYNSRHTGRTAESSKELNNSDNLHSYDKTQDIFKNFNNTKTMPSVKYTEEFSESQEVIYEPKDIFTFSTNEYSSFFATHPPPSSKNLVSVNESNISENIDADFLSNAATQKKQKYHQDFSLERNQPSFKPIPTSSPEERISESQYYQANYSSESDHANHPNSYGLSQFPENAQYSTDYLAGELHGSQIIEEPASSLGRNYTFPSNSLSTVAELSTTIEPVKPNQGKNQIMKQDFNYSAINYDELPIDISTAANESVIFLPNTKQKFSNQAFSSVSVKYPSFSKIQQTELKNNLALSKPFISSPFSTIFDTSSENGQYYHYVMNLGQKSPTSKGIAKTKVYSSGKALYTILHEDEFNNRLNPSGYGFSELKNGNENYKVLSPEYIDQSRIDNIETIVSSKPNFESREHVLIYNATTLPQNYPNKLTYNELNDTDIDNISHTLVPDGNLTEIYPLIELTTQPIQTEFPSSNVKSEINSTSSFFESIFNESINQTGEQESSTIPSFLADSFEINESLNNSSFLETSTAPIFPTFGNISSQSISLNSNQFQGVETTQSYSETENALSYITVTETSAEVPSTFDYLGNLDHAILQRIYLLAKKNGSVSFGNVSYKLDLNKLLNVLNENAPGLKLTTENTHETTVASLFYDSFTETSTSLPVTTENSRSHTPLYSEDNSDIGKISESTKENSLPVSNLFRFHHSGLENTLPLTESTTSVPIINSSPMNNNQLSFESSKVRTISREILPDLLEVTEPSNIGSDASEDPPSHPMLELIIKNSSLDDFISNINRVPVVIRVFNPISKSYHSVLITPEDKSNKETNFVDTDRQSNTPYSEESIDNKSNISDSELIKDQVTSLTGSDEGSSDVDQTSNTGVYFDTILPNESLTDNTSSITPNENDGDSFTSVYPSKPERNFISIEDLKDILLKSVEQSVNLPTYSKTLDEVEQTHNALDMSEEKRFNDKFPMLAKQSQFPIEMKNISPEDISISISESVVINPEPDSDSSAEIQDIFKNDQVPSIKSEPRETEMNMSMLKNVDDPIKMVFSIMETYKSPKEATMWKNEAPFTGKSTFHSPLQADSQITNKQSSDERKTDNKETPFIVSLQEESPMGNESLTAENYELQKDSFAKDGETPFVVPLKVESHGNINQPNDDKPLHLIPIYFEDDEYETPAESQSVYEFQKINGDLKRIYPESKTYNNGLSRPSHPSDKTDKVSHKADHAEFLFTESSSKTNHRHNADMDYGSKIHPIQDFGTYLQYSRVGSLNDRNDQKILRKSHSQVTGSFSHSRIASSSSNILPEYNDDDRMFRMKETKEIDVKKSQNFNADNLNQLQESELPEMLSEGALNSYQEVTDLKADDTVDVPVLEYPFRDIPQHSDRSTSTYTSFQKDDKNDYHTVISRTDRLKNRSEKNGKSYYRTLPQYISPEITIEDSIRDNRQISHQASDDSNIQGKSSTSHIQKLNIKGSLQHSTSETQLQNSSNNWDDIESTVKRVKAIPYVEPKRNQHAVTDSENSRSDEFILLQDTDATVDKPNNKSRRDVLKIDDKISDVMIKSEFPLNDDKDYLYPIFKTYRSKYERSLSD